jgi:hypothetical protein
LSALVNGTGYRHRMWWRALGVAAVLLCAGVAGGYAVADRSQDEPVSAGSPVPIPAESPAVPTPPVYDVLPDPLYPAIEANLPSSPVDLRVRARSGGVTVNVPDGWDGRREQDNTWSFTPADAVFNSYKLRVVIVGRNVSIGADMAGRMAALMQAQTDGNLQNLQFVAQTDDTFEATYIDHGYQRWTMEKWVSFNGSTADAEAAVTGRVVDEEGLRDLLGRTIDSMQPLDPLPPKESETPSP